VLASTTIRSSGRARLTAVIARPIVNTWALEPVSHPGLGAKSGSSRRYVRRLAVTDAAVIVTSVGIAQFGRFGTDPATLTSEVLMHSYTAVSSVLIIVWFSALVISRSREPRVVGNGVEEFPRVARASIALFGSVAIVSFLLKLEVARGYLAVALPLGLISLLLTRWLWRRWLRKERSKGRFISTVLVVGSHKAAAAMAQEFERMQSAGYRVAGVCVRGWGTVRGAMTKILDDFIGSNSVRFRQTSLLYRLQSAGTRCSTFSPSSCRLSSTRAVTGHDRAGGGAIASDLSGCKTGSQCYHPRSSTAPTAAVLNSRFYEAVPAVSLC
jgi:hypothetical protein